VYVSYNKKMANRFQKIRELGLEGKKSNPLLLQEFQYENEWVHEIWTTIMQQLMKIPFGMRRCKRLLRIRKSALGVCTWIGVRIMSSGTKWQRRPQSKRWVKQGVRCMIDYTNDRARNKGRRTSIGWPKAERGRRGTSSKLNALRMRQSDS
jgi:hypothetical protein